MKQGDSPRTSGFTIVLQRWIQASNIMERSRLSYILRRSTSYVEPYYLRLSASLFSASSVIALCCCLFSLFVTALAQTPASAPPAAPTTATSKLEPAKTLSDLIEGERELKGGETHSYRIQISSGQFFHALVEQKGIDVVVVLYGPDGKQFGSADSPNDRWGTEPILFVADTAGAYRVDIRSPNARAAAGRYSVKIVALREASVVDRGHVAAQRAFEEAAKLRSQPAATSKRAAIEKDKQALSLFQAAGNTYRQALTLRGIGLAYAQLSEFRAALPFFREALLLAQNLEDKKLEASMEANLGGAFDVLGEMKQSLDRYQRALTLAKADRNQSVEASVLNNIGKIHSDVGEWQKALEYYLEALPLFRSLGSKQREAITLNNLGVAYSLVGEQGRALDYLQQSLPLLQASGDRNAESYTLTNIGHVYRRQNDYQTALKYYEQAQVIQLETGNLAQQAETLDFVGVTYSAMGQPAKALEYHQQALKIDSSSGNPRRKALLLNNLGHVYNLLGQPEKALEDFSLALKVLRDIGDLNSVAQVLEGSARAEMLRGNLSQASKYIEESLTLIETVRAGSGAQDLRAAYLASREKAYEFNLDLLMQRNAREPGQGYDAAALGASERGRARSLLEMLNEAHVDIREGVDAALVKKEREISQSLNAKAQRQIQLTAQEGNQQEIETLKKEISALEDEYQQVQVAIRKASPGYAALTQPQPLGLKEIQTQLDQGTVLLEYSLGEERSYVWAVTRSSLKTYELPKREQIEKAARRVYDLLTARSQSRAGESAQQKQERIAQADSQLLNASKELSQMVLGPIGSELGAERLVIVADGALQYVPFAMLPLPETRRHGDTATRRISPDRRVAASSNPRVGMVPLIEQHEIVSLPSASALAVQREGLRNRKPAPNVVAVIADPVFSSADERLSAAAKTGAAKQVQGDGSANTRLIEHLADDSGLIIRRLKFTRQEADQILAEAPRAKNLRAIDFKANRATVTGGELSKYRYVHFATHGYIDSERSDLSAIVLSLVDEEGNPQDGFLRAHEIYNLNLPAELVVLSACETGLGKEIKGEGLVGLTRGFMYAGARRVVVSLWNVNDKATAELMARFYRGMLRENKTPAAALRTAQVEMSRQKQWQSPYYWAAFVLQGEWK